MKLVFIALAICASILSFAAGASLADEVSEEVNHLRGKNGNSFELTEEAPFVHQHVLANFKDAELDMFWERELHSSSSKKPGKPDSKSKKSNSKSKKKPHSKSKKSHSAKSKKSKKSHSKKSKKKSATKSKKSGKGKKYSKKMRAMEVEEERPHNGFWERELSMSVKSSKHPAKRV